jgi:hypothetical protein
LLRKEKRGSAFDIMLPVVLQWNRPFALNRNYYITFLENGKCTMHRLKGFSSFLHTHCQILHRQGGNLIETLFIPLPQGTALDCGFAGALFTFQPIRAGVCR